MTTYRSSIMWNWQTFLLQTVEEEIQSTADLSLWEFSLAVSVLGIQDTIAWLLKVRDETSTPFNIWLPLQLNRWTGWGALLYSQSLSLTHTHNLKCIFFFSLLSLVLPLSSSLSFCTLSHRLYSPYSSFSLSLSSPLPLPILYCTHTHHLSTLCFLRLTHRYRPLDLILSLPLLLLSFFTFSFMLSLFTLISVSHTQLTFLSYFTQHALIVSSFPFSLALIDLFMVIFFL